jgi:hypothetical protein
MRSRRPDAITREDVAEASQSRSVDFPTEIITDTG